MVTLEDLRDVGFDDKVRLIPKRSILSIEGWEKSGKTRLALTAREPVIYLDLDWGSEGVIEPMMKDRQILVYQADQPSKLGSPSELIDRFKGTWSNIQDRIDQVLRLESGTLVIDTFTEIYEICRLAHHGKLAQVQPHQYAICYADLREIFRLAHKSKVNVLLLHKLGQNFHTGVAEFKGWSEVAYSVQGTIRTERVNGDQGPEFSARIVDCRPKPELMGRSLAGPCLDMEFILSLLQT